MTVFALALFLSVQGGPSSRTPGAVAGQVRMQDGRVAAGVRIAAQEAPAGVAPTAVSQMIAGLAETDAAGRFRIEGVPPGRYYITAGFLDLPSYYPGVSNLTDAKPVVVAPGATVSGIDFALVRSAGVKVSGRVNGFPSGAAGVRVMLQPTARTSTVRTTAVATDTVVLPDGTFQFLKVPPGAYAVRMNPAPTPATPLNITVDDRDIANLELTAPRMVAGSVSVEDGSKLPVQAAAIAAGIIDPPTAVRIQARRVIAGGSLIAPVRSDGTFLLTNVDGEFDISVQIPFGYWLKSMTFGTIDLTQKTFKTSDDTALSSREIRILLTREPPDLASAGVTVRGTVAGLPDGPTVTQRWVLFQTNATPTLSALVPQTAEIALDSDGTFAIPHVPPGSYVAYVGVLDGGRAATGPSIAVTVGTQDVNGLELSASRPAPTLTPLITYLNTPLPPSVSSFQIQLGTPLTIVAPEVLQGLRVPTPSQVTLRGRLMNQSGRPLPTDHRMALTFRLPDGAMTIPIQPDGLFSAQLISGEYAVTVEGVPDGFKFSSMSYGGASVLNGTVQLNSATTGEFVITLSLAP